MKKRALLEKSISLITGDREEDYGDIRQNFKDIADGWAMVFHHPVEPWQVAACMVVVKLARLVKTPEHIDSWADASGYIGIGCELATESTIGSSPTTKDSE